MADSSPEVQNGTTVQKKQSLNLNPILQSVNTSPGFDKVDSQKEKKFFFFFLIHHLYRSLSKNLPQTYLLLYVVNNKIKYFLLQIQTMNLVVKKRFARQPKSTHGGTHGSSCILPHRSESGGME